jgi:hypothetical protein
MMCFFENRVEGVTALQDIVVVCMGHDIKIPYMTTNSGNKNTINVTLLSQQKQMTSQNLK